jgi:hypothetical protein
MTVEVFRVPAKMADVKKQVRVEVSPAVQAAGAAKIRYSGRRRDAGSGPGNDVRRTFDKPAKFEDVRCIHYAAAGEAQVMPEGWIIRILLSLRRADWPAGSTML